MIRFRASIASAILASIGSLFLLKYGARYTPNAAIAAVIYFAFLVALVTHTKVIRQKGLVRIGRPAYILSLTLIALLAACAVYVLPDKDAVSRLPAISIRLHNFLNGRFPYGKPINPSSFPVLFLIAVPFYYLGNIGMIEVCGIVIFSLTILKIGPGDIETAWLRLLVLALLPTTYYEVMARSDLFFNMSLVLAVTVIIGGRLDADKVDLRFAWVAVLFGFALSTRSVVGLVYVVFTVFKFKHSVRNGVVFTLIVIVTFCATFVPFMLWNLHAFETDGPFSVQLAYVSGVMIALSLVVAMILGYLAKSIDDVAYYSGLILFGLVLFAFIGRIITVGFGETLYKSSFDIGYFILSVPFLIVGIGEYESERRGVCRF